MTPQSKKMLIDNQAKKPLDKIISRRKNSMSKFKHTIKNQIQFHIRALNALALYQIKHLKELCLFFKQKQIQ